MEMYADRSKRRMMKELSYGGENNSIRWWQHEEGIGDGVLDGIGWRTGTKEDGVERREGFP